MAEIQAVMRTEMAHRRRAEVALRYVIAHARCILWHADIEEVRGWREGREQSWFRWHLVEVHDPAAAQLVLALDVPEGQSYLDAWVTSRHPDDARAADLVSAAALRSGQSFYSQEFRCCDKDGREHWFFEDVHLESDTPGRWRAVGVCTDITSRKLAQAQHEQLLLEQVARDEAQRANRAKDHFLAVLSHELRTPLAPVLATAAALEQQAGLAPELHSDLELIRRNVELEARLIDDLLDVSRIAQGKLALRLADVDVHAALQAALHICQSDMHAKGIEVHMQLDGRPCRVRGDSARLQQVFWNLLKNAVKFTPGGGRIMVRTEAGEKAESGKRKAETGMQLGTGSSELAASSLTIEVSDTGMGIHPLALPRIFDAFEQAEDSITQRFGGLGLGLAIAKHLVEAHGGTLAAASAGLGQGATFTIKLPLLPSQSQIASRKSQIDQLGTRSSAPKSLRILLVEDHADMLRIMARLLRGSGHEVVPAGSVQAGLEALAGGKFDLLLSDLALGDGDGFDLMRQARDTYGLRGIAISGCAMEEDIERSRAAGFSEHLTKPITLEQLEEAIRRAV